MREASSAAADSYALAARSGRSSRRPCKDRGTGGKAAVIVDHTESRRQADIRILHLRRTGGSQHLPQAFDQTEIGAGSARLSNRQLSARGIMREVAVNREIVLANEGRARTLLAEAKVLKLHHGDDRIIVI